MAFRHVCDARTDVCINLAASFQLELDWKLDGGADRDRGGEREREKEKE